jgi:hypothetical protein
MGIAQHWIVLECLLKVLEGCPREHDERSFTFSGMEGIGRLYLFAVGKCYVLKSFLGHAIDLELSGFYIYQ